MKKILTTCFIILAGLTSCDKYLDQSPLDIPTSAEDIFTKRTTTERYLWAVYNFVPRIWQASANGVWGEPWVPAADEADNGFNHTVNNINNGSWNPGNIPYDKWDHYWQGIREATYFMQNLHMCKELDPELQVRYYGEAKFLRAYYYWLLMRLYGPVPLLPDEIPIDPNDPYYVHNPMRNTWEDCVEYVTQELTNCAPLLKQDLVSSEYGRVTPGVALAVRAQVLLFSASELFNPRNASLYAGWKSAKTGENLIPVTYDANKWKLAADAAKDVIDLTFGGNKCYSLMVKKDGNDINPYKSLYSIFVDKWNAETIFGRVINDQAWYQRLISRSVNSNCWGGINPSQKLVDAYAMKNGKYPITGYADATATTDGGEYPIIDASSGYFEVAFEDPFNAAILGYASFVHPFDGKQINTVRMWIDREPRFYMDIAYNAMVYYYGVAGDDLIPSTVTTSVTLGHHRGGSGGLPNSSHTATGYCQRKMTSREINPIVGGATGFLQPCVLPMIRLAEMYLNYVEALIEYDHNHSDILKYWNELRTRAGVPDIETVYPELIGNQNRMRELIRRERQVELALEGHRYFDCRRWRIAEKTNNGMIYGMNIDSNTGSPMGKPKTADGVANFYKRTVSEYGRRVFKQAYYLWPINQNELNRNRSIEQAPGW